MHESALIGLTLIIVLGIAAQWLAWKLALPSILLMLSFGILIGPVARNVFPGSPIGLDPDKLLGTELLLAFVSISVGIILFEGGLTLRWSELSVGGKVVARLSTLGAMTTWAISAIAAYYILDLNVELALLFGGILVVSGPTVVQPLMRHVRPIEPVASILKWEAIVVDPIGALLAVLVYEAISLGDITNPEAIIAQGVAITLGVGVACGALGAGLIILMLRRYWVPDFLQSPLTLMVVVGVLAGANFLQSEAGLFAVTLMGMILANQRLVSMKQIFEFKKNLTIVLVSSLFIMLAARLHTADLHAFTWPICLFLAVLFFVARPLCVWISTVGSGLPRRERWFLAWMAPRGIVAASVSSVFALKLSAAGAAGAERLTPLMFIVIIFTVSIYGLTARWVARRLQVSDPDPQGLLIVGAQGWSRAMAQAVAAEGFRVFLVDTNHDHVAAARMAGLDAKISNILAEGALDELSLQRIGRLLAVTPNDDVNSLCIVEGNELFDRVELYRLSPQRDSVRGESTMPQHLRGRLLFDDHAISPWLSEEFDQGAVIKKTKLTDTFTFENFRELYGKKALPMFLIDELRRLRVFTSVRPPIPKSGQTIIALVSKEAVNGANQG